jgi:Ca2+-binding RTX toxin-like protein
MSTIRTVGSVSLVGLLLLSAAATPVSGATPTCAGEPATIVGTDTEDTLNGTPGDDVIVGLGGADVIYGGAGNDLICGGPGDDIIHGGAGDDVLRGGRGRDAFVPGVGSDTVQGGAWIDKIDYRDASRGVVVDLRAGTGKGQGFDTIADIEIVIGSEYHDRIQLGDTTTASRWFGHHARARGGDDVVIAGRMGATVWPGAGNDTVIGGPGNDVVESSAGNDTIYGRGGDDRLFGGIGRNVLRGGQ